MDTQKLRSKADAGLLTLQDISLNYGELEAVHDVCLDVCKGEIHAIVGEHGAGKSTVAMVMGGMLRPRSGSIYFEGKRLPPLTPKTALKLGIRMVHQQVLLNDYFTVAENMFYTSKGIRFGSWNPGAKMVAEARMLLEDQGFKIDPTVPVRDLSISDRAVVDLLKQIRNSPRVLVLDEALEKLASASLSKMIGLLLELREKGTAIVFITHRIDDVYDFADKVSILRNGELIFTDTTSNIDKINLIRLAYTQFAYRTKISDANLEFYRFLKYSDAILRRLPVSIVVTETDFRVKMTNEEFCRFFQLERTDSENRQVQELLVPAVQSDRDSISHALESREERSTYHVPLHVGDRTALTNIRSFPVLDGSTMIGHILVIEDITEYDRLQQQVLMSEKLASVGLLAAGVAHEINNPLEIIYNYIRYLKRTFEGEALHDSLDRLGEEVANIASIVSNLAAFSDTNKVANEELDLNETIGNLVELVKFNQNYDRVKIEYTPTTGELEVLMNKNELRQVVLNLLKNSLDAMPSGGKITVTTDCRTRDGRNVATVSVVDQGPGIKQTEINNIFLPFYSTKTKQGDNVGLGLAISYSIMQKHGGGIETRNIPNGGCEFLIWLPVEQ